MTKPVVVAMSPSAFRRYRLSLGAGVFLGVLFALLIAFLLFRSTLMDEPQRGSQLILYYLLVLAPVGIAGGFYGLKASRHEFVRVSSQGISIDIPSGPQEISWLDICCIRVLEDSDGNTLHMRLYRLGERPVNLHSYLPLDTLRQAIDDLRPIRIPLEINRSRINWSDPEVQNLFLALLVGLLAVMLWW